MERQRVAEPLAVKGVGLGRLSEGLGQTTATSKMRMALRQSR